MQDKILYIIAGANGSGKSTLASELLPSENLDFLNADEVAKEICPENIESVKIKAGKIVLKRLEDLLNGGHDIPKNDIIRRYYRSKGNFWNIYKDLVDEWNLFYNGTSEYILVAQYANNEVEIFSENLYNEFIKDFE